MTSMQLTLRLAGLPVDRDRHGGNIKIDGDTINHFDFGMTDLELPTESQKRALGKVLAQASKDSLWKGEFSENVLKRIDSFNGEPEVKSFLAGFKREMLAMGDYINAGENDQTRSSASESLTAQRELKGMFGNALYGEHADPIIQNAYKAELGILAAPVEYSLQKAIAESSVEIGNVKSPTEIQMPELTTEEHAIVTRSEPAPVAELPATAKTETSTRVTSQLLELKTPTPLLEAPNFGNARAMGYGGAGMALRGAQADFAEGRNVQGLLGLTDAGASIAMGYNPAAGTKIMGVNLLTSTFRGFTNTWEDTHNVTESLKSATLEGAKTGAVLGGLAALPERYANPAGELMFAYSAGTTIGKVAIAPAVNWAYQKTGVVDWTLDKFHYGQETNQAISNLGGTSSNQALDSNWIMRVDSEHNKELAGFIDIMKSDKFREIYPDAAELSSNPELRKLNFTNAQDPTWVMTKLNQMGIEDRPGVMARIDRAISDPGWLLTGAQNDSALRNSDWALPDQEANQWRGKLETARMQALAYQRSVETMNPNSVGKSNLPPVDSGHEQALKRLLDKDPNAENLSDDPEKAKLGIKKKDDPKYLQGLIDRSRQQINEDTAYSANRDKEQPYGTYLPAPGRRNGDVPGPAKLAEQAQQASEAQTALNFYSGEFYKRNPQLAHTQYDARIEIDREANKKLQSLPEISPYQNSELYALVASDPKYKELVSDDKLMPVVPEIMQQKIDEARNKVNKAQHISSGRVVRSTPVSDEVKAQLMKPLLRAQEQLDAYRVAFDAKHKPATLPHIDATSSQPRSTSNSPSPDKTAPALMPPTNQTNPNIGQVPIQPRVADNVPQNQFGTLNDQLEKYVALLRNSGITTDDQPTNDKDKVPAPVLRENCLHYEERRLHNYPIR